MTDILAQGKHFQLLNEEIRRCSDEAITIHGCNGQRYIASGLNGRTITIHGTPGNALGAYLDGCRIDVYGNVQEATGDTMNDGCICVHGAAGDATGYAMRGGCIYVRDDIGYRAGIHMKAYQDKAPLLVAGGKAGSFLGEYQAGGRIVVLGLQEDSRPIVGRFCGTGMHGGDIVLRCNSLPADLPEQVIAAPATDEEREAIARQLKPFCDAFALAIDLVMDHHFFVLRPNTKNPYKRLYTPN